MGRYEGRNHSVFVVPLVASQRSCGLTWRSFELAGEEMRRSARECNIFYCIAMTILDAVPAMAMQHWIGRQLRSGGSAVCLSMRTQMGVHMGLAYPSARCIRSEG